MSDFTATTTQNSQKSAPQQLTLNLQELLNNLFLVLTEKEVTVIKKRFALQGQQKQTLEKIGKHFKVTRERIRQIESIALGKLKRTVRTTKLHEVNEMATITLSEILDVTAIAVVYGRTRTAPLPPLLIA